MPVKYHRILAVKSLSAVENPWKGISLNRCIFLALSIVVLSSGLQKIQETLEPFFDVANDETVLNIQDENIEEESESSWWDNLALWIWNEDDDNSGVMQSGEKSGLKGIRKRVMPGKKLLKERD